MRVDVKNLRKLSNYEFFPHLGSEGYRFKSCRTHHLKMAARSPGLFIRLFCNAT